MEKKYLFFDIDGTLACGGYGKTYIPASCIEALKKVRKAGHFTAISTGRAQCLAEPVMKELGFHNMVSDGGYGLTIDDELESITPLDKEKVIALIDECNKKYIPWGIQVDNSDTRLVPDERFENFTHDDYIKSKVVEGLDPRNYEKIYKAYVACFPPVEESLKTLHDLPWCRFHTKYLFVEPCDKGLGIKRMMDHMHADYSDVVVFGDAMNDMNMFLDDWTSVAMGNACEPLKQKADYITTSVDHDGIYNACEALHLF